jgi:hypothetical protein
MDQFAMQAGRQKQKSRRLLRVAAAVRDAKGVVDTHAIRIYVESRMSRHDFAKGCELGVKLHEQSKKEGS